MIFAPMSINLLGFKVNVLDRSSSVNLGPNQHIDIFVSSKQNYGFGEDIGDLSPVYLPLNVIVDPDLVDSNSNKNSVV